MTRAYFESGGFGNYAVHVEGLRSLQAWAKEADPKLKKALTDALKETAQPVLRRARANASRIADDGTYGSSLSIGSRMNGSQIVLKSNDPAAGVKEFARIGAKTISSKGTKLADSRLRKKSGVGVPRRAHAPRVMVPAVNDSADEIESAVEARIAEVLEEAGYGGE